MLDAMLRSANFSADKGVRFYRSIDESERITYAALDLSARHEAVLLRRAGLRPGDRVVLAFEAGLDFLRALYATMYAGLVAVPAPMTVSNNVDAVRARILEIADDSGSRLVLISSRTFEDLGPLGSQLESWHLCADGDNLDAGEWEHPGTRPGDVALIQYTSGSIATPRGVTISHANLVANQRSMSGLTDFGADTVIVGWLPHYHDMGLVGLYLQPVFGGFELIATSPAQFLRRPVSWLQLITRYRATTTVAPDFAYNLCVKLVTEAQLQLLDLSSLRAVVTGAEPVRPATLRRFSDFFAPAGFNGTAFVPAYGMAETTLLVTAKRSTEAVRPLLLDGDALERGQAVMGSGNRSVEVVPCGPPTPDHRVMIIDRDTLGPAAPGMVGEIWVAGPSIGQGYWGRPEETAKSFGATLPDDDASYLRTGDLGFLWQGELIITGRINDLIIIRGRNIYPNDLESAISSVLSVRSEAACAAFEEAEGEIVVVVESRATPAAVVEKVRRDIAGQFSLEPLRLVVVRPGSIPRTSSGKVQRRATRNKLANGSLPVLYATGSMSVTAVSVNVAAGRGE